MFIHKIAPTINSQKNPAKTTNFCGVADVFRKNFISTQQEIIQEFAKDPKSRGIVGGLPPYWRAKLDGNNNKAETIEKIQLLFRAAIKHLKPYNAPPKRKGYRQDKANLENRRLKEASAFLTKGLRHFGILSETNSVHLKRLKVKGNYIECGYLLNEKGENPTLEKLFIKKFKEVRKGDFNSNCHGKHAEIAHGFFINHNIQDKHFPQFYWGDIDAGFLTTEYLVPPKGVSPTIKLKSIYQDLSEFSTDLYKQTGISTKDLFQKKINFGKLDNEGRFIPADKIDIIKAYIQAVLAEAGLVHFDFHSKNAVIGSTRQGQPILKLIDIGGVAKK